MKKVLGIGNALVDILVHIDNDEILDRLGLQKGGMEMIDAQRKREILEEISGMPQTMATGGSTSNTISTDWPASEPPPGTSARWATTSSADCSARSANASA